MKLYAYWRSSASWRVRIGLHWKGIPFELCPVNLLAGGGEQFQPAHRARNPMATVPVLEWSEPGPAGAAAPATRRLSQSMAILEYLEETRPLPPLLPRDPLRRAQARMLAEHVNSGIQPLQNLSVLLRIRELVPARPGGKTSDALWAQEWIARLLGRLEEAAVPLAGRYLLGDEVTLPDLFLVPQLYHARRFEVDPAAFPTLARVEAALAALPAFAAAHAERQPDAPAPLPQAAAPAPR
jgi:maleylpyruvate isomerase